MMKISATRHGVRERVTDLLVNQGWIVASEDDPYDKKEDGYRSPSVIFVKAMCDQFVVWFGTKNGEDLHICQYTYHPELWPGLDFSPVKGNDNFSRHLVVDLVDEKDKPISEDDMAHMVLKWFLIPGYKLPIKNKYNPDSKGEPRRGETEFMRAQKRNQARKAIKDASKKK